METKKNQIFLSATRKDPDRIAVIYNKLPITQLQILQLIQSACEALESEKLDDKDRVLIILPATLNLAIIMFALIAKKLPFFVINPGLNPEVQQTLASQFDASCVITDLINPLKVNKTIVVNKLVIKKNNDLNMTSQLELLDYIECHDFFKFDKKSRSILKTSFQDYFADIKSNLIKADHSSRFLISPINHVLNFKYNFLSLYFQRLVIYPDLTSYKKTIFLDLITHGITHCLISENTANALNRINLDKTNGLVLESLKKLIILSANEIDQNTLIEIKNKFTPNVEIQRI